MAEDARISTAFPRHHKTVKLQRRLGLPSCWALLCLFLWVVENRFDGDLKGMTNEDIEIAAGWAGAEGEFAKTLAEIGFLDGEERTYVVHDWEEHQPYAAGRGLRIEHAKAAAHVRWSKNAPTENEPPTPDAESMRVDCEPDASGVQGVCGSNAERMPHTTPNPTTQNPTTPKQTKTPTHPSDERKRVSSSTAPDLGLSKERLAVFADEVYAAYPRKVARSASLKAITKAITTVAKRGTTDLHPDFAGDIARAAEWLEARTLAFAGSAQGRRADTEYIPHPATWFNGGRFDDDDSEWNHVGNGSPRPRFDRTQVREDGDSNSIQTDAPQNRPAPSWMKETQ